MKKVFTVDELKRLSDSFEGNPPQDVLKWVVENFSAAEFALASSFAEATLVDMLVKLRKDARVFLIDTGFLFKETLDVVARVEEKYCIRVERHSSALTPSEMETRYGRNLWETDPDKCCELLKVLPLKEALSGLKLWITGLRRDESPTRKDTPIVGWDKKFGLIKVNPLACWTKKQVWDYVLSNGVPYNPLLDKGYTSIGCTHCTRPVKSGEDERSGRWAGKAKTECGIHK